MCVVDQDELLVHLALGMKAKMYSEIQITTFTEKDSENYHSALILTRIW